jgi:hypothetical protein
MPKRIETAHKICANPWAIFLPLTQSKYEFPQSANSKSQSANSGYGVFLFSFALFENNIQNNLKKRIMKKIAISILLALVYGGIYSQDHGGNHSQQEGSDDAKWNVYGNQSDADDFLGTKNNFPINFRTNNTLRMSLGANGILNLNNLAGPSNRLLQTDAIGNIIPFNLGNNTDVLYGNGSWGALPAPPPSFWSPVPGSSTNIFTNNNVGIGTNNPQALLHVAGNMQLDGDLILNQPSSPIQGSAFDIMAMDQNTKKMVHMNLLSFVSNIIPSLYAPVATQLCPVLVNQNDPNLVTYPGSRPTWQIDPSFNGSMYTTCANVGIDVTNPLYPLHVGGSGYFQGNAGIGGPPTSVTKLVLGNFATNQSNQEFIRCNTSTGSPFIVDNVGAVTSNTRITCHNIVITNSLAIQISGVNQFKVDNRGFLSCRDVLVTLGPIPDYVFEKEYDLKPLNEVEKYVTENKHLPNVPSATEMKEKGTTLGELELKLLEKVEELTLYSIKLEKRINEMEKQLSKK